MELDLELDKAIKLVKKHRAKRVMLQLPDGLKPRAKEIADAIESNTGARVLIWGGSCFGACDIPQGLNVLNIDLLIQFGHAPLKC
ncbi:hypothetical protein DRJ48_05330 [Candidatus Woesearchaeota archaeon]|nr:diphthamide synthesis protein [Candidatus Woesearchaeota archaeon]RLE41561.1 MAG: hypothetical protein DRJ48_05330 [Candidatus Woesearchaeota archaeon]